MIRYARTGPALSTQHGLDIGWSTTCDREYTVVVHINVVMFRGSFQCETPSRHVYTMNISHQTACSAILVGFLHASNRYDTWCKYFASNCSQKISFLRFLAHPASIIRDISSMITEPRHTHSSDTIHQIHNSNYNVAIFWTMTSTRYTRCVR